MSASYLRSIFICWWLTWCAAGALLPISDLSGQSPHQPARDSTRDVSANSDQIKRARIRFSWGGGSARQWSGEFKLVDASIGEITLLGLNPDTPGSVYETDTAIAIRQLSPTTYSGFDLEVSGAADAIIQIDLFPVDQPELKLQHQISIRDVFQSLVTLPLDDQNNRLTISRAPGDLIQVDLDREHMVFETGERFQFDLRANWTELADGPANCKLSLVPARSSSGGTSVGQYNFPINIDETGSSAPEQISIDIPVDEGVYDLQVEISAARPAATFLSRRKRTAARTIQFVAIDSDLPNSTSDSAGSDVTTRQETVATIEPRELNKSTNRSQFSQISRMVGFSQGAASGNGSRLIDGDQGELVELAVGGWQAITLSIQDINAPHMVEIEFPDDVEMATGVSILQPDAAGQISLFGFDSGWVNPRVLVRPASAGAVPGREIHRFVFWPATDQPVLLIANRHSKLPAQFGTIRITRETGSAPDSPNEIGKSTATRRMMAFYELPHFPENFGANEFFDSQLQQPVDDWVTFYSGAKRLIHHLRSNGYQGAFINVASDGSAIYPSRLLQPTPKLDSGVFCSTGRDPIRKDVVELLFRMFERSGLQLVPTLAFTDTLPAVQAATRAEGAADAGLVSYRNEAVVDRNRSLPRYNPLDPRVQKGVLEVISEITNRYGDCTNFQGVAIICRPDTFTLLPGRQWGYDRATLQRFVSSLPAGTADSQLGLQQLQNEILSSLYEAWLNWRAKQMSEWYSMLANAVASNSPNGKLYLAPVDLYRGEEIAATLFPSLHRVSNVADVMQRLGFDHQTIFNNANIRMLKPHRMAPNYPLESERAEYSLQKTSQLDHWFDEADFNGDLYTHRSSWAHFHQLEKQPQFSGQNLPLMRLQPLSPVGAMNRERFATALFKSDSRLFVDGGWLLSVGQDHALAPLVKVFSKLPDQDFETLLPVDSTPHSKGIVVRHYSDIESTYFYIVNATPWSIQVSIPVDDAISEEDLNSMSAARLGISKIDSRRVILATVEPYGLVGGNTQGKKMLKFGKYSCQFPENAGHDLRKSYFQLRSDLISSGKAQSLSVLQNPGFESEGNQALDGWSVGDQRTAPFSFDLRNAKEGSSSLRINNPTAQNLWIRSNDFLPSQTGRLSISVWLRTDNPEDQPPLRISVEGVGDGSTYYRFGTVGSLAADNPLNRITKDWKRFAVHFDDLPLGLVKLRIGFDMMGRGNVWVDQCQVYDRWFDENDVKAMTQLLASAGLLLQRQGNIEQCRQILTGYWPTFLREYYRDPPAVDSVAQRQPETSAARTSSVKQRFRRLIPPRVFQFR